MYYVLFFSIFHQFIQFWQKWSFNLFINCIYMYDTIKQQQIVVNNVNICCDVNWPTFVLHFWNIKSKLCSLNFDDIDELYSFSFESNNCDSSNLDFTTIFWITFFFCIIFFGQCDNEIIHVQFMAMANVTMKVLLFRSVRTL